MLLLLFTTSVFFLHFCNCYWSCWNAPNGSLDKSLYEKNLRIRNTNMCNVSWEAGRLDTKLVLRAGMLTATFWSAESSKLLCKTVGSSGLHTKMKESTDISSVFENVSSSSCIWYKETWREREMRFKTRYSSSDTHWVFEPAVNYQHVILWKHISHNKKI